jgi:hypothetical protein
MTLILSGGYANGIGFRNRIINGDMRIDQRNAGAAVTVVSGSYAVDRFRQTMTSDFAGVSSQQDSDAPSGFTKSLKWTVTSAASAITTQQCTIRQNIEGYNIADLGFGQSGSETLTLSFWVRSSVTGTYCIALRNSSEDRSLVREYTISSADTWEYKTITAIPKDTTGTWNSTNGSGVQLHWDLGSGPDRNAAATDTWYTAAYLRTSNQTNWVNTSGATFYLTGVQLEVGSVATPFERRPYGTELILCQRYFNNVVLGDSVGILGLVDTTTAAICIYTYPVQMRATPSLTTTGTAADYRIRRTGPATTVCSAVPVIGGGTEANNTIARINATVASGLTGGQCIYLDASSTTKNLGFSAEL